MNMGDIYEMVLKAPLGSDVYVDPETYAFVAYSNTSMFMAGPDEIQLKLLGRVIVLRGTYCRNCGAPHEVNEPTCTYCGT